MSSSIVLQGRHLVPDDIEFIRRMIADHPDWRRTRLSREICQLWNWRTDKGAAQGYGLSFNAEKTRTAQADYLASGLAEGQSSPYYSVDSS